MNTQPPYPLHESIVGRIDAEYAEFYNRFITDKQQVHLQPIEVSRSSGILIPGSGPQQPVASIADYSVFRQESKGPNVAVRCFTPEGAQPAAAGPLAPENPFPAAVHDAWEAVLWVLGEGKELLHLDTTKLATGGSSAGGNLAAVMCQRAVSRNLPNKFSLQLLAVPVTDNTADVTNNESWLENQHSPALPAPKMLWYRDHYLPNRSDWDTPEASPIFWKGDWSQLPPACLLLGELDVLRTEGERFAKNLEESGLEVAVNVMKGQPHPFLAMDGVLEAGSRAITLFCDALRKTMYPSIADEPEL